MVQRLTNWLMIVVMCLGLAAPLDSVSWAQENTSTSKTVGPRKQIATIIFSGLAGAILGLSTLSFYGRPQDKLSNIAVGFAVGIIIGTTYTTYKAATQPRGFYDGAPPEASWRLSDEPLLVVAANLDAHSQPELWVAPAESRPNYKWASGFSWSF